MEDLQPDATFIGRDGSRRDAWLVSEHVTLSAARSQLHRRFWASLLVKTSPSPHSFEVHSCEAVQACAIPDADRQEPTYERRDGRCHMTHSYEIDGVLEDSGDTVQITRWRAPLGKDRPALRHPRSCQPNQ